MTMRAVCSFSDQVLLPCGFSPVITSFLPSGKLLMSKWQDHGHFCLNATHRWLLARDAEHQELLKAEGPVHQGQTANVKYLH